MYHAALEIKTETMTHMHSRKGYTTLGKVNWVGQLHCFVPFLPLTNPFSSSSFVFFSHHHSLVFTRIAATLFLILPSCSTWSCKNTHKWPKTPRNLLCYSQ